LKHKIYVKSPFKNSESETTKMAAMCISGYFSFSEVNSSNSFSEVNILVFLWSKKEFV